MGVGQGAGERRHILNPGWVSELQGEQSRAHGSCSWPPARIPRRNLLQLLQLLKAAAVGKEVSQSCREENSTFKSHGLALGCRDGQAQRKQKGEKKSDSVLPAAPTPKPPE